jgi:hypothetical protein
MAAQLAMDPRERLRRLSVVFEVALRMQIVLELYMREMSARQFYEEFGGGSLSRVSQNFTRLAEKGWLRHVHSRGPGGTRHGGVEHFFRATAPPFIDGQSWALVPFSVRAITAWNFLKLIIPRLRNDIEALADNAAYGRELTCNTFLLDEEGWMRAATATTGRFGLLFEEQEDARRRTIHSGEELVRADVFLIAFEPAGAAAQHAVVDQLVECRREPLAPFTQRLAPILRDDLRLGIVGESNGRDVSVPQFHREFGGASRPVLRRRFKGLERGGWMARTKGVTGGRRRGASEQFFRATKPAIRDHDFGADALRGIAGAEACGAFESLCELAKEAMIAGTFDMRTDRCLSWSLIRLDRQGWENVVAGIESLSRFITEEEQQAKLRMAQSGEKPIPLAVGFGAFEALKETIKAP